ncbi:MAG: hypothetical protein U5O44_12825 [Sphaerotilus sp.]|nr:hypothetical protein [Sphaerotilus sp.]
MYIDKVRLTNIRGFRDLEFSFDRGNGTARSKLKCNTAMKTTG